LLGDWPEEETFTSSEQKTEKKSLWEFNNSMVEILDRIYEVFAELNEAKKTQDSKIVSEKEKELDQLRRELSNASKYKGSYASSAIFTSSR
jgi:hypothetical protein